MKNLYEKLIKKKQTDIPNILVYNLSFYLLIIFVSLLLFLFNHTFVSFVLLYMPRLLSNAAHMFVGDDTLMEEAVNSEPYVVKMMIDQETDKSDKPNTQDTQDEPNNQNKTESTKA